MMQTVEFESRRHALELAVQHHGAANRTDRAIPANPETVVNTAVMFADYLTTGTVPTRSRRPA